jgi:hypothetical protein
MAPISSTVISSGSYFCHFRVRVSCGLERYIREVREPLTAFATINGRAALAEPPLGGEAADRVRGFPGAPAIAIRIAGYLPGIVTHLRRVFWPAPV